VRDRYGAEMPRKGRWTKSCVHTSNGKWRNLLRAGFRIALGAARGNVFGMVLLQGARLALLGLVIGLFAALAATRFLTSFLYGVRPTDPLTFAVVAALLVAVALLACYLPARRATRVDPLIALRYE